MLVKHVYSSLLIEDFIEEILLDKQGLKNLVNNYKFQFYFDWFSSFDNLDLNELCIGEDDKYYFDIIAYRKFFIEFILNIKDLIDNEEKIFKDLALSLQCEVSYITANDVQSLVLISDIYSLNPIYFNVLDLEKNDDFLRVKNLIEGIYDIFKQSYFVYKHSKNVDQVLTGIHLGNKQKFDQTEYIKSDKKVIYLDTNAFSQILEKSEIRRKIILSKDRYQYCYSPYLLEDKIKQNIFFRDKVFNVITEVTDNVLISSSGDYPKLEVNFRVEDPKIVFNRVKLWLFQTKSAEDNQFNSMILQRLLYKKNENLKFSNAEEMIKYLINSNEDLEELACVIGAYSAFDKDASMNEKISSLLKILDVIEFKVDSKKPKIISSFQDQEHLRVAYIADYFITDDSKLIDRAKVVYKVIDCEIKVQSFKDFLKDL